MPEITLGALAERLGGALEGDPSIVVRGVAGITEADEGQATFVANPRYVRALADCRASVAIVSRKLETAFRPLIRADNPYLAFTQAMGLLLEKPIPPPPGIHSTAAVSDGACIGERVSIGPHVTVEADAVVGDECVLFAGAYVGRGCRLGAGVRVYPNAMLAANVAVGERAIVHARAVLGSGWDPAVPGEGGIRIGHDVEIGASVVFVMPEHGESIIGENTKMDNLVHIGRNVTIGRSVVLVGQVEVGDSAAIEDGVVVAGQAALATGIRIGERAVIGAGAGVRSDVPAGTIVSGNPAQEHGKDLRFRARLQKLADLAGRVEALEASREIASGEPEAPSDPDGGSRGAERGTMQSTPTGNE